MSKHWLYKHVLVYTCVSMRMYAHTLICKKEQCLNLNAILGIKGHFGLQQTKPYFIRRVSIMKPIIVTEKYEIAIKGLELVLSLWKAWCNVKKRTMLFPKLEDVLEGLHLVAKT